MPLGGETCFGATYMGLLNCLKYVHENECAWNEELYFGAA